MAIFSKINKYYDAITYGLLKIMHFNDVCLLFSAKVKDFHTSQVLLNVNIKIWIFYLTLY